MLLWLVLGAALAISAAVYITHYYYRDLLFGPPVDFDEDHFIEIGLYPNGHRSVLVLTCDDVTAGTDPGKVDSLLEVADRFDTKTVFFVVPFYKGRYMVTKDSGIAGALRRGVERGHEVALHGLTHSSPRKGLFSFRKAKELGDLSHSEQKRRIKKGKRILEACGLQVAGFRSPAFSASIDTMRVLDTEEFLYSSDTRIYPFMLMSNKRFCESLYYPYHPGGLSILDLTTNGDYFWGYSALGSEDLKSLKHRFDRFYENRGSFVLLSHIDPINSGKGLWVLEQFLEYAQKKDLWRPTLKALAEWWLAREVLFATSEVREDTLYVTLEKGSEFPLNNLSIRLKPNLLIKNYKIMDVNQVLLKEGKLSEGTVTINV